VVLRAVVRDRLCCRFLQNPWEPASAGSIRLKADLTKMFEAVERSIRLKRR
jgi:hypothetical protein